jgi:hypothetical protein
VNATDIEGRLRSHEVGGAMVDQWLDQLGQGDPQVILRGRALLAARYLVEQGIMRVQESDSIDPPRDLLELRSRLNRAAAEYRMSLERRSGAPLAIDQATSAMGRAPLGTAEAARVLKLSVRHVQRLAPSIGARRVGRAFLFDPETIKVHAAHRLEKKEGKRS